MIAPHDFCEDNSEKVLLPVIGSPIDNPEYKSHNLSNENYDGLFKERAYRNYLLSRKQCNLLPKDKHNRLFFSNSIYKYYEKILVNNDGSTLYDVYKMLEGTYKKIGCIVVPSDITLYDYVVKSNPIIRYKIKRHMGSKVILQKYEFCNGAWLLSRPIVEKILSRYNIKL